MRIAIGADHKGFELKEYIKKNFNYEQNIKWIDVGTNNNTRTDYPLYTLPVCLKVLQGSADVGILISSTGVGMSIAANRFSQIYAGIAWSEEVARLNKEQNNVNILILPADFINQEQSFKILNAWLSAEFKGERYKLRLNMIDVITDEPKVGCCG